MADKKQETPVLPDIPKTPTDKGVTMVQAAQSGKMGLASCILALGGAGIIYYFCKSWNSRTSIQFAIIAFFVTLGLLAFWQSWRGIREERHAFETAREKDLEKETLGHLVEQYPADPAGRAKDAHFTAQLQGKPPVRKHGIRWHHCERLHAILAAAFPVGENRGSIPLLSNLRMLSESAELCRRSVWVLNTIVSSLLIVGIFGTLYGVHEALPISVEERIDMGRVRDALLPSAVAVGFTILLIILRAMYRYEVSRHLGRLDRHTLRFHFPMFREDGLNEARLQNLEKDIAALNDSLTEIINCVKSLETSSAISKGRLALFRAMKQKLETLRSYLDNHDRSPEKMNKMAAALLEQANSLSDWYSDLKNRMEKLEKRVNKVTGTLLSNRMMCDRGIETLESVSGKLQEIRTEANERYPLSAELLSVQQEVMRMLPSLKGIESAGAELNRMQSEVVAQTLVSVQAAEAIKKHVEQSQTNIETNKIKYDNYRLALMASYDECKKLLGQLEGDAKNKLQQLDMIREHLEARDARQDAEPYIRWQEVLLGAGIVLFLVYDVWQTWNILFPNH